MRGKGQRTGDGVGDGDRAAAIGVGRVVGQDCGGAPFCVIQLPRT